MANAKNGNRPNLWGFLSNVFVTAINRGQIIPLGLILLLLVIILRMPNADLADFSRETLKSLETWHVLGWIISVLEAFGGFLYFKRVRKKHTEEIKRIAEEKTDLQTKSSGKKFGSSNRN